MFNNTFFVKKHIAISFLFHIRKHITYKYIYVIYIYYIYNIYKHISKRFNLIQTKFGQFNFKI